ncbi:hypothetical protein [Ralstonia solanacearum]|nr:hypothetical protein [Ralstonia solanacearum]
MSAFPLLQAAMQEPCSRNYDCTAVLPQWKRDGDPMRCLFMG